MAGTEETIAAKAAVAAAANAHALALAKVAPPLGKAVPGVDALNPNIAINTVLD